LVKIELDNIAFESIESENSLTMDIFKEEKELLEEIVIKEYDNYIFAYSYYNPDLGGVNCHEDNWLEDIKKCKNTSASGKGWREYIKSGVAIHPDMLENLPFGTIIEVIDPEILRGEYEVIDLCSGCRPKITNGFYYIDFVDTIQIVPWGSEIKARVLK